MNRSFRTTIVISIAVGLASLASYLVYRTIKTLPTREVEVAQIFAVVAARPLPLGTLIAAADVKRVPWPAANPVPGGFVTVEQVTARGVIAPVAENEPLTANNLAPTEAGAGLPPTIPSGMRAISVKVNEVIGVAGFVVPGTRVDVMVILSERERTGSMARVVVSNVQVLAAGTKYDRDDAKDGEAIPSSVVTLMVSPDDAERIGLASIEGQILLTLRNPLDTTATTSAGIRTVQLTGDGLPAAQPVVRRAVVTRVAPVAPAPVPPPTPAVYTVETIRAGQRTQETVK